MYSGYGSGYNSYGGGYGGYGNYGNYGSYNSMGTINNPAMINGANPNQDPRRPPDERRNFMEEYFKMMGGLNSMIQIGFSMVAFSSFTSQTWQLLKKIVGFLLKTSTKLFNKFTAVFSMDSRFGEFCKKLLMVPSNANSQLSAKSKLLMVLRIVALIFVAISYWLQGKIAKESTEKKDELLKEYKQTKQREERERRDQLGEEVPYQKEGYI